MTSIILPDSVAVTYAVWMAVHVSSASVRVVHARRQTVFMKRTRPEPSTLQAPQAIHAADTADDASALSVPVRADSI
jgi:hypothetical protein